MSGLEVVKSDISTHPCCPHGPTILFSRLINGKSRNFFVCAACRHKSDCNFFVWQDEVHKINRTKQAAWKTETTKLIGNVNQCNLYLTFNEIQQLPRTKRCYCKTCSSFQLPKYRDKHTEHDLVENINNYQLTHPSEFLTPLDNAKKEAQYLFSNVAVMTILGILRNINIKNVLSIGTPRIHEHIVNECLDMSSLLLDFDKRYLHFYSQMQFCWYNMFNDHFFLPNSREVFQDFLQTSGKDLILIIDPPFGGRLEPLAETITKMQAAYKSLNNTSENFSVFFIFPYFMEPQIQNHFVDFQMLDYKVDYENHPLFQDGEKGRKCGSPVRIFTNVNLSEIKLPADEGYKLCKVCDRWVAAENKHCNKCKACTSKDGRTYVHCQKCKKCVKPTWVHCEECNKCAQQTHKCEALEFIQTCFHCKQRGHKKALCPNMQTEEITKKRKKRKSDMKIRKKVLKV